MRKKAREFPGLFFGAIPHTRLRCNAELERTTQTIQ